MRRLSGFHAIEEYLKSGKAGGRILVAGSGPRIKTILELARKAGLAVEVRRAEELDRLDPANRGIILETEHEAVAGEVDVDEFLARAKDSGRALVLVLDHVEDPQNLGALVRSADVFACDLVVVPRRRAAPLSDAAARASAGALAHVPVALVPNLAETLRRLAEAGFWRYAADMDGTPLPQAELPGKFVLVLGNEGAGVSRVLRAECDGTLAIPQAGHVDSLNVSAAGAIFLYEYRRRYPVPGALSGEEG